MSWIIKESFPGLQGAIKTAAKNSLLICSTADEGSWSGKVFPADYDETIKVAATDKYGNLSPYSDKRAVTIPVPGENIPAIGPTYMGLEDTIRISGSSVATALAAVIASLALFLLRVFNPNLSDDKIRETFYDRKGMVFLLSKFNSKEAMSALFPENMEELPRKWNFERLKEELNKSSR